MDNVNALAEKYANKHYVETDYDECDPESAGGNIACLYNAFTSGHAAGREEGLSTGYALALADSRKSEAAGWEKGLEDAARVTDCWIGCDLLARDIRALKESQK